MLKKLSFSMTGLMVALVLALGSAVTAFAITIVVDGDQEAVWTSGSGGQMPGHMATPDPNEADIGNSHDVRDVYWTNDSTNFYLMLQTYATPSLAGFPYTTDIYFCIDTDNNVGTGGTYANCDMSGIDRFIHIAGTSNPSVYDGNFNPVGTGTLGYNPSAATTPVIEVSVPLADLGLSGTNCTQTMPMAVYFDGGTGDNDDSTPDSGTIDIGCGAPTAITLNNLSAASSTPYLPLALGGAAFVLVAGAGLALRKRYMA